MAAADRLQSPRNLPVHPRRRAVHEAAAPRQDRQSRFDSRPRLERVEEQRLCGCEGRDHSGHPQAGAPALGPFGVTINAIAPSLTLTELVRPHWDRRTQEAQDAEIARTPLRRVAEATDQAKVICFLASNDADFVTGVTIDVTGGN